MRWTAVTERQSNLLSAGSAYRGGQGWYGLPFNLDYTELFMVHYALYLGP
jgi:hypothetical protein